MRILYLLDKFPVVSQTFVWDSVVNIPDQYLKLICCGRLNDNQLYKDLPETIQQKIVKIVYQYPSRGQMIIILLKQLAKPKLLQKLLKAENSLREITYIWRAEKLLPYLISREINLIHTEFVRESAKVAYYLNQYFGYQYTITVHGFDLRIPIENFENIVNNASLVFAPSIFHRKTLADLGIELSDKIKIIPLGVNTKEFSYTTKKPSQNTLRIICVARLHPVKNHQCLLKAYAMMTKRVPNTELVLAGGGELESEIVELARQFGIYSSVIILGECSRQQIKMELAKADIFVLASIAEGLSISAIEAASMSLPIVATDVGGMNELIYNNQTGLLVESNNAVELADALIKLSENPQLRESMGAEGRRLVEIKYNKESCFKEQLDQWLAI